MAQVELDTLKAFDELLEPDSRQKHFAVVNRLTGEAKPLSLRDKYQAVEMIALAQYVPDEIREHFDTARNLLVYSWFVYRFNQVAELHAFASLEFRTKDEVRRLTKRLEEAT